MSGTFVVPNEWFVLNVANVFSIHMGYFQQVGQLVEGFLRNLPFVNYNCIVEVTTLDEVSFEQRHYVANKYECSGRSYFVCKFLNIVERCKLTADEFRVERTHRCYRELFVR